MNRRNAEFMGAGQSRDRDVDKRVLQSRAAMRVALVGLLSEHQFQDISAAMVSERAGVGYATFFRHYADTEALLLDVANAEIGSTFSAMLPALVAGDYASALRTLTEQVAADRATSYALLVSAGPATQQALTERAIERVSSVPVQIGKGMPSELVVRYCVASSISILNWWVGSSPDADAETIAGLLYKLVYKPVMT
jgi:AcrR family transcriptional regulator